MSAITIEPISEGNYLQVLDLKLLPEQELFVASNARSIVQAYVFRWARPVALVVEGTVVGFMMYGLRPETRAYWLLRLMIGVEWQGRGYGTQALQMLLGELRAANESKELYLSLVPANEGALRLYRRFGFEETGEIDEDGEIIMRLSLEQR